MGCCMKKLFREDDKIAYYASDGGKIFSLHKRTGRWYELKPGKTCGYQRFMCCQNGIRKNILVHRAVWEAFNGPILRGLEINHKNCVRDDNRLENLELVTSSQNNLFPPTREHQREAKRHKMKPVLDVTTGITYDSANEAARQLGLDSSGISKCCRGRISHTGGHAFAYVPTDAERLEHEIQSHIETLANELSGGML